MALYSSRGAPPMLARGDARISSFSPETPAKIRTSSKEAFAPLKGAPIQNKTYYRDTCTCFTSSIFSLKTSGTANRETTRSKTPTDYIILSRIASRSINGTDDEDTLTHTPVFCVPRSASFALRRHRHLRGGKEDVGGVLHPVPAPRKWPWRMGVAGRTVQSGVLSCIQIHIQYHVQGGIRFRIQAINYRDGRVSKSIDPPFVLLGVLFIGFAVLYPVG